MPRIFKYGDIPNICFTSDKDLNILIYRSPSYLIIYRSHTLLKMVHFLAHPVQSEPEAYCIMPDAFVDNQETATSLTCFYYYTYEISRKTSTFPRIHNRQKGVQKTERISYQLKTSEARTLSNSNLNLIASPVETVVMLNDTGYAEN